MQRLRLLLRRRAFGRRERPVRVPPAVRVEGEHLTRDEPLELGLGERHPLEVERERGVREGFVRWIVERCEVRVGERAWRGTEGASAAVRAGPGPISANPAPSTETRLPGLNVSIDLSSDSAIGLAFGYIFSTGIGGLHGKERMYRCAFSDSMHSMSSSAGVPITSVIRLSWWM